MVPCFGGGARLFSGLCFSCFQVFFFSNVVSFFVVSLHVYDVYERRQASDSACCVNHVEVPTARTASSGERTTRAVREDGGQTLL